MENIAAGNTAPEPKYFPRDENIKKERAKLPLTVLNYGVDQISFFVKDMKAAKALYANEENSPEWIDDIVIADDKMSASSPFIVSLAFNYTLMPVEFELLQLVSGSTVQLPYGVDAGLSHLGIHTEPERLDDVVAKFEKKGFRLMGRIDTVMHSNAPDLYSYIFLDTRPMGFITKLIEKRR